MSQLEPNSILFLTFPKVAQAMWWVAQAMWSGLRRLCGGPSQKIMPLRGSILQVGTCQILSLAENPRWSRVWQQTEKHYS